MRYLVRDVRQQYQDLDLEDDFSVVGTETDGQAALEKVITLKPDVAILDIEMPGLSGLEIAKQLRLMKLDIKIIILTTFARSKYFKDALAAFCLSFFSAFWIWSTT